MREYTEKCKPQPSFRQRDVLMPQDFDKWKEVSHNVFMDSPFWEKVRLLENRTENEYTPEERSIAFSLSDFYKRFVGKE